jgi:hypothetical protein
MRARAGILIALVIAACGGEAMAPRHVATSAVTPRDPRPLGRALPGPGPQARGDHFDVKLENDGCIRCHQEIAAEWRESQHHEAWDDPVFIAAYAMEPIPFCRRCHAPEIDERLDQPDNNRHLGVACVTCHVLDSRILGRADAAGNDDAHPVTGDPRLGQAEWCSTCHDFAFPDPQDARMQGTVLEHRDSQFADKPCQDCHMPLVGQTQPHKSHAFRVQGNVAMLRSAMRVTPSRSSPRSIRIALSVDGAGHAVPTGDMFRRIVVRAEALGAAEPFATQVVLARQFRRERTPHGSRRLQIGDTRLPSGGQVHPVDLVFADDVSQFPIRWEVAYQRMGPTEAALFGVDLSQDETSIYVDTLPVSEGHP